MYINNRKMHERLYVLGFEMKNVIIFDNFFSSEI